MKLRIRGKIFLISLALVGVSLAAAELYLGNALQHQLNDIIRSNLLVQARLIAQRVAANPQGLSETTTADALADEVAGVSGLRVTLVRADGSVAGDSEVERPRLAEIENHASRPEIREALASGQGSSVRYSTTVRHRMMYVAVPIEGKARVLGTARVAMPLTSIDEAIGRLHQTLWVAALLSLLVSASVALIAAHLGSQSMVNLTAAARRIATGDLSVRVRMQGNDEVAALGNALDQLAESLSGTLSDLRSERDLVTGILSGMHEGVLVVDKDLRIMLTNPALRAMLLIGPGAEGQSVLSVVRHADLNELLIRASRGGSAEMELDLQGMMPRRLLVRAATLPGEPGGVLAVFVDLTELRRLEAVRREFVASASHELRSPLTAVRAAAETLAGLRDDPAAAGRFVAIIQRNAERLESLVDDMLELSRIEMRETRLVLAPVTLTGIVERLLSQQGHRAETRQIALGHDIPPELAVTADRRALEHILANLLDNALRYCPDGASINIRAAVESDRVRVAVADTGPGIPPEHLPRLFERFYRVDPGRSRELGGTGLGLAIVKHLVEAMGGSVSVESRPGAGAVFSFTLQLA